MLAAGGDLRSHEIRQEVLSRDLFAQHGNLLVDCIEKQQLLLGAMTRSAPDFRFHAVVIIHVVWGSACFVHQRSNIPRQGSRSGSSVLAPKHISGGRYFSQKTH
uniref:Uncharacterized protein n=1 Tax=Cupriavidus pinatubonensis (strain JMP 134 / LMG 1197) TaxID=264198 RepID=Q46NX1_CUPPJ